MFPCPVPVGESLLVYATNNNNNSDDTATIDDTDDGRDCGRSGNTTLEDDVTGTSAAIIKNDSWLYGEIFGLSIARPNDDDDSIITTTSTTTTTTTTTTTRRKRRSRPTGGASTTVLKMDSSTGTLQVPSYRRIISSRQPCPLLQACWNQDDWQLVVALAQREPFRALHKAQTSGRTALHLAVTNNSNNNNNSHTIANKKPCPLHVIQALLLANRHMVLEQDVHHYTPIHLVAFGCGGRGGTTTTTTTTTVDESTTNAAAATVGEAPDLLHLLCDTAVMVEQELQGGGVVPPAYGTSPLYLACKRNAPLSILQTLLLQTRRNKSSSHWSSPSSNYHRPTPAQSKTTTSSSWSLSGGGCSTSITNCDDILHLRTPPPPQLQATSSSFLDGTRHSETRTIPPPPPLRRPPFGYWIAPSTGGEPYWDGTTLDEYSSPLEVLLRDRIHGIMDVDLIRQNQCLRQQMRQMAQDRFDDNQKRRQRFLSRRRRRSISPSTTTTTSSSLSSSQQVNDERTMRLCDCEQQQKQHTQKRERECLKLWEKCLELLVDGYCPLLEIDGNNSAQVPYGILHSVTCCKVPVPALVQVVLTLFPEQVLQRDEQGLLPLHHVLRANHKYATTSLLTMLLSTLEFRKAVTIPLWASTGGPTPLAFALKHGLSMETVVQKLLTAGGHASLGTLDPSTQLYPFGLAVTAATATSTLTSVSALKLDSRRSKRPDVKGDDDDDDDETADDSVAAPPPLIASPESSVYKTEDVYMLLRACPQVLTTAVASSTC